MNQEGVGGAVLKPDAKGPTDSTELCCTTGAPAMIERMSPAASSQARLRRAWSLSERQPRDEACLCGAVGFLQSRCVTLCWLKS